MQEIGVGGGELGLGLYLFFQNTEREFKNWVSRNYTEESEYPKII